MKVMTIVGTRPEIIKLSCVIPQLDRYTDHILVHTGQNYDYELNEIFFSGMGIRKPDVFMEAAGETAADTIGEMLAPVLIMGFIGTAAVMAVTGRVAQAGIRRGKGDGKRG